MPDLQSSRARAAGDADRAWDAGVWRGGIQRDVRPVAACLALLFAAVAVQLLPIQRATLDALSPHTAGILLQYSPAFANGFVDSAPLSINPRSTQIAVLALGAFGLYLIGVAALLGLQPTQKVLSVLKPLQ